MANNPKKLQDPTEAALSAIQEALNLRDDASTSQPAVPVSPASAARPAPPPLVQPEPIEPSTSFSQDRRRRMRSAQSPAPGMDEEIFFSDSTPQIDQPHDEVPVERRAANDDRQSVGQILQALQRRPSSGPYVTALIFSAIWIVIGLVLGSMYFGGNVSAFVRGGVVGPQLLGTFAAIFLPVAFFFVLAHMVWRAQELRGIARAMTEVAMRLAEPETLGSESVVTVGQAIRREVAAMGDGVERALARAAELEALVHNEVAALERAYNDNELRIRGLLEDIANQRDILVTQADQVRQALSGVQLGLTQDIASVSEMVASSVNEAAQRITRSLAEKGEHITIALGRAGDSMIDAVGERGGDLLEHLNRTSDDVSRALKEASDSITSSIDLKTDRLSDEVIVLTNNLAQMLSERLDQVTQDVSARTTSIAKTLAESSKQISDGLVETGTRLAETVLARADEANSTLKATGESLVLDLTLRGSDVVAKLEETGTKITETIITRTGSVTEAFRSTADNLTNTVNARADSIKDMLVSRLQSFEDIFSKEGAELADRISRDSGSLGGLITRHLAEFDRTVKVYGGELVERLEQRTEEVTDALRSHVENFDTRVGVKTNEAAAAFDTRITRLQEAIESRAQTLNDSLGSRIMDMAKTLAEGGREVVAAVERRIEDVNAAIDGRSTKLANSLSVKADEIDRVLGLKATEIAASLDSRVNRFEELLGGRVEAVVSQIEVRGENAANAINARVEQLSEAIRTNAGEAERSLTTLASSTVETIRATTTDVERTLTAVASGVASSFKQNADVVRASAEESERLLTALSTGVSTVLKQNAGDVEKTLLGVGAEVVRSFTAKADEMTSSMSARAHELSQLLDSKSGALITAIDHRSQQLAGDIDRVTVEAVKAIEVKGLTFGNSIMKNSQELARLINDASAQATTAVNRSLADLQTNAVAAVEQSRKTASTAIAEVMETHNVLRNDTSALFERLRDANHLLQEVLTGATQNLGKIEATLSTRVGEFVKTMNDIADRSGAANTKTEEHIKSFHAVTSNVLRDITLVAHQMEGHGRALAAAADLLEKNNVRNDAALTQRQQSLEQLTTALDSKTEDLDLRLKRFGTLLEQTFQAADAKARDIARTLAELSSEGARAITENFELVRSNAEQERKRTAEDMLSIYEQAAGDTNSLFRQASERFGEIVRDMKAMAAEMQRELDTTRAEMRKGILELPQETAESAAQMRRVIVEQMDALAELNRIVARHGRGIDTSEPSRRSEPVVATIGGRAVPRAEAVARSSPARKDSAGAPPTEARGGWLSDVLSRASRDESQGRSEERNPRHAIESLDSLSVDIARMIDHDAAAELWDRYKRGERNVFTRRLYTMQGQKTFDDIRKRYRADREFKQTVDRYISEFERLLEEVSRNDRDSMVARTYLTSETGKVYTMLAHASGRLEN